MIAEGKNGKEEEKVFRYLKFGLFWPGGGVNPAEGDTALLLLGETIVFIRKANPIQGSRVSFN